MPRHPVETHPVHATYLERLHNHMLLIGTLREGLLELLSRPEAPTALQHWITTILEQNRQQERQVNQLLQQHGEPPHHEHNTVSTILNTVVSCFPTGEVHPHLLGAMLDIAGYIARLRTSLALIILLAEKLSLSEDAAALATLRQNSKNASRSLKEVLPSLLDVE